MPLHDFQQQAHEDAVAVLRYGGKALFVSPTGSGKSFVQACNHKLLVDEGYHSVVPSTEIGLGIYDRCGYTPVRDKSPEKQQRACEDAGIWTVMRLLNELMKGTIPLPKMLGFDEAHHTTASSYETVHAICGDCPAVAYTATGFRGTPQETAALRAKWGEPRVILTLKSAVDRGIISRPDMKVWPLLNDELIKVANGEFETKATEGALEKVVPALCDQIVTELCDPWYPKRPTMVTAPGVGSARYIYLSLRERNAPAILLTGDQCLGPLGTDLARQEAFQFVTDRRAILVQVNVVGEGVDLPIRVQVDTAPTMSPVRFMQRIGRGTRPVGPGEQAPVYICTNHNIGRFSYLWAGVLPSAQLREAQQAWGPDFKPSRRLMARAIGLEGFGKFTVSKVPLADGSYASLYALQTPTGTSQYAVLLHPCREEPMFFQRDNPYTGEEAISSAGYTYKVKDWGRWRKVPGVPDLDGYVSTKPGPVTEKVLSIWKQHAERLGLDPEFTPNAREAQALFVLLNTNTRFKVVE